MQGRNVFYTFPPSGPTGSDVTKLSIPLTIAVLGAVLFMLVGAALVWQCCEVLPWTQSYHRHYDEVCIFLCTPCFLIYRRSVLIDRLSRTVVKILSLKDIEFMIRCC